ncbi:MAG: type II secretion system major pseudopilin GspG [bacterium]
MKNRNQPPPPQAERPGGFSFIEILVVLIILALIAGIVGTQLLGEAEKAKASSTKIQIKSLGAALDLYRLHNSRYPTSEQGLAALLHKPELGNIPDGWQGPYLNSNSVPNDGWKNPFVFISDGRAYEIRSLGADGEEGGNELATDISSAEL